MEITLNGEFTDLNTYIRNERGNRYGGAGIKKQETERVYWCAKAQKLRFTGDYPVLVRCTWFCKNKRKDKDNIAFAKKYILDGLVMAGVLKSDGWDAIAGFIDRFHLDKDSPRVTIELLPASASNTMSDEVQNDAVEETVDESTEEATEGAGEEAAAE